VVIGYIVRCTALAWQPKNYQSGAMMVCASQVHGCHLQCDVRRLTTNRQLMNVMRVARTLCVSVSY
jgi:hypothetical protein